MSKDAFSFVIYMIHKCAAQWNLSPSEVYCLLEKAGCIKHYLVPHYEVLHTQSSSYVVEDMQRYLKERGVAV